MKKSIKTTYAPPMVHTIDCELAHTVLTGSVIRGGVTIKPTEVEEEWEVS